MKLQNICVRYGEKTALDGVTLEFRRGETTAILGASGAGKTTLLGVIARRVPFTGEAEETGRISYLFQSPKLLPNLTVEENLRFVLDKSAYGEISPMLEAVGLKGMEKERPSSLSGGELRRVALARAFLFPHDVLLMDEPFSSLDLVLKREMLALTAKLWKERGDTVIFVTHDAREAAALACRAVFLKGGEVSCEVELSGTPLRTGDAAFCEEKRILHACFGEEEGAFQEKIGENYS